MSEAIRDPGSFRDPSGGVYRKDGRVFRTVNSTAEDAYLATRESGLFDHLQQGGLIVELEEVQRSDIKDLFPTASRVLEHPCLAFISYPYEWSFPTLKAAALAHLDIQLQALERGMTLSDASAYNIQFNGPRPVFIDHLSFRPYVDGEIWKGHRQFCEQFLNPLLLRSLCGVSHNAWYRGEQEGIRTEDLAKLVPFRKKLSWNILTQVVLPAAFQRRASTKNELSSLAEAKLPRLAYQALLEKLRSWIRSLEPADGGASLWSDYASNTSYSDEQTAEKRNFVAAMVNKVKPSLMWDLGCNTGDYSCLALESGADYVIGFDFDQRSVEIAFDRAQKEDLKFLPLWLDAANPSPSQGWAQRERPGFQERASADALIALAFIHHIAIGRNIPLAQAVSWLIGLAPNGVIEFVPKTDPMVKQLLALREDIFEDYSEETFLSAVEQQAEIVKLKHLSEDGRLLVWYDRS